MTTASQPNVHASAERRRGLGRNGKALHGCAGSLAGASLVRVAHSASIGHFRQDSPTLRQPERREFRSEKEVAPQVGFEPTTLRLTADPVQGVNPPYRHQIEVRLNPP